MEYSGKERRLAMLKEYKTIKQFGQDEWIIKKSKFIGYAQPVSNEEEAVAFIERIKKQHWNATHNCSAFIIGERDEIQRSSDDGEPSGTAGKPILEVIRMKGLKNTAVVVTRYFGGIMLGAGGLIRAYTQGAVIGIQAAGTIQRTLHRVMEVNVDYSWVGKIQNELEHRDYILHHIDFLETVTFRILVKIDDVEEFLQWVTNLTSAQADIVEAEEMYVDEDIQE
jgi:uncharacterized YigZ family protein